MAEQETGEGLPLEGVGRRRLLMILAIKNSPEFDDPAWGGQVIFHLSPDGKNTVHFDPHRSPIRLSVPG